jgi:hypothetical protein
VVSITASSSLSIPSPSGDIRLRSIAASTTVATDAPIKVEKITYGGIRSRCMGKAAWGKFTSDMRSMFPVYSSVSSLRDVEVV